MSDDRDPASSATRVAIMMVLVASLLGVVLVFVIDKGGGH
jgi:hypothetical protein